MRIWFALSPNAPDQLRVVLSAFQNDLLHPTEFHGESDNAPGKPGAIEVTHSQAVAMPFKGRGQLQTAFKKRGDGASHEQAPDRVVDVASFWDAVLELKLLDRGRGALTINFLNLPRIASGRH